MDFLLQKRAESLLGIAFRKLPTSVRFSLKWTFVACFGVYLLWLLYLFIHVQN
jgi:hypothetical protein